jgi:toxin YhaV
VTAPDKPGWSLFAHPAFSETFNALVAEAARLRAADPEGYRQHPKIKLLKRIVDLIEVEIPRDSGAAEFSLGNTLGPEHRHWRRAKFLGRFRLFFRYSSKDRIIIYAWVNDEKTLRKAGGRNDLRSSARGTRQGVAAHVKQMALRSHWHLGKALHAAQLHPGQRALAIDLCRGCY